MFNFNQWFNSLKISEDIYDDSKTSLINLLANNLDASGYITSRRFIVNNIGFIEKDGNDKYFIEFSLPRNDTDISTKFTVYSLSETGLYNNVKISLVVNDRVLSVNGSTEIVNCCSMYTDLKIRLTFDGEPFTIGFTYICYILHNNLRETLMSKPFIHNNLLYQDGSVIPVQVSIKN